MKKAWRHLIDGLVVILAIYSFGPAALWWFGSVEDQVTPDETKRLDEIVSLLLEDVPMDFTKMVEEQSQLSSYDLTYLMYRKPLTPAFNYLQSVESVVYITAEDSFGYSYGTGSVITEDGLILTNRHIIEDAERVMVTTHDGSHYPVTEVVAVGELLDVAFLKVDATGLDAVPIGDDERLAIGETTLAIGHPEGFLNTISTGVLSGRRNYHSVGEGAMLQITNAISGGNSGGMVLNEYGELIGIPTATVEYANNSVQVQNINLAIPISDALSLLDL